MSKIIGVDIDGVLTKEGKGKDNIWLKELNKHFNYSVERVRDSYDFREAFNLKESELKSFLQSKLAKVYSQVEHYPRARKVLKKLKENGITIYLITARSPEFRTLTEKWLSEKNISYDYLYHEDEKAILARKKNIDIFIEDKAENILELLKVDISVIVMDRYHNQKLPEKNIYRAYNWEDIEKFLKNEFGFNFL
ncbi:MAG: 5' nucleotidase, NT5C type [Halanaerobiales bacterium]